MATVIAVIVSVLSFAFGCWLASRKCNHRWNATSQVIRPENVQEDEKYTLPVNVNSSPNGAQGIVTQCIRCGDIKFVVIG